MKLDFKSCNHNIQAINIEPIEVPLSNKEYICFGGENNMPDIYYNAYTECSTLQAVINTVSDYVYGDNSVDDRVINRKGETLSSLVKRCILDYQIFGSFALQVIRSKAKDIVELNYIDVRNVRLNEDGTKVFIHNNWNRYARNIRSYEAFNGLPEQMNSVFYYKAPRSRGLYGTPMWSASLRDVLTLIEASKINYHSVLNQFTPTTMISFANGTPAEDVQDKIERMIHEKFTSSNGNNILLSWSDDREHIPEIKSFETPDYTERYTKVMESCRNNIMVAFRCSGQLVGLIEGQTGFNDVEFTNTFSLFKHTVISPLQREIEQAFKTLGIELHLNEYKIEFVNGCAKNVV